MKKETYYFNSTDSKTKLHAVIYKPEIEAIATLIVSHGIGEYIERYEEFAEILTGKGISVTGYDVIGHGESISNNCVPMYFGENGSWKYLVNDLINFNGQIREKNPKIPCFMLGFSMGSFVLRCALATNELKTNGIILVGTGKISTITAKLVKSLISKEVKKIGGDDKVSDVINNLAFGNYNKYFKPCKTEFDWLCEEKNALKNYIQDDLAYKFITPGMFRELLTGMDFANRKSVIRMCDKNIPVLFVSGENDPVGGFQKGVKKVEESFRKNGLKTTLIMYPKSRHDVLRDTYKELVISDIYNWIESNL